MTPNPDNPSVKEALLYEKLSDDRVRCGTCERRCVVSPGERGFCKTRQNVDGKLYTLVYGDLSSVSVNPIEKKPFFHFWPGSHALTVGSWSCNFTCPWCQNWSISKYAPKPLDTNYVRPEDLVRMALREECRGTSISFNEPTLLFEYSLDVFPSARRRGLYNTYVSNGYMTVEALRMLKKAGMDAIKFDVKGDREAVRRYCGADVDLVWRNIGEAKRLGMHVEVVSLIIPGVNDCDDRLHEVSQRHIKEAGPDSPLHFTRFHPDYEMTNRAVTPIETLEKAYDIARREGVHYVYLGNVQGHRLENTYCSACGAPLIERYGFNTLRYHITTNNNCPKCGQEIPLVGRYIKAFSTRF